MREPPEDPLYLAFDTSGPTGSVAVGSVDRVLAMGAIQERMQQAARLVPTIDRALRAAGADRGALTGLVVGEGPGSFTGVRVAAATAKGLAHALSIPLWAVSSLTAAATASSAAPVRYVLFDARSDRVYGACYRVTDAGVEELVPPHPGTVGDVLGGDVPTGSTFVGEGSHRHREALESAGFSVAPPDATTSLAEGLLRYRALAPRSGRVRALDTWEPRYVRASSAERLWTR